MTRPGGLTSEDAWVGVWVRMIAGPNTSGKTVHEHPWHRIIKVDDEFLYPDHSRATPQWPWMGSRMEVYRPGSYGGYPPEGRICSLCTRIRYPLNDTRPAETQELVDEEAEEQAIDLIVDRVIKRLEQRA